METKVPFLDLKAEHAPLRKEFDEAIRQVIDSNAFAGGPFVTKFEEEFAAFCDCEHAIGLGSGTEALWLVLLALGIGPGDEVITVPSTFMATAEAITYCGATPTFVDIGERTYTMDPALLEAAITEKTKAIIPVHLFGQPSDMDPIMKIAGAHKLPVIEDAAQAHGAEYKGRPAGTIGVAGCFSFYPGKNLGAFGEAGAVITNDSKLREKIRTLRDHGQVRKYYHSMIGWNCRMDGIQAAVLSVKLRNLKRGNDLRRQHAAHYTEAFSNVEHVVAPLEADYAKHVYHVYAIRVPERNEIMEFLARKGIGYGVHYPVPVHLQEAYRALGYEKGAFPIAERTAEEFLSLPMYPTLTHTQRNLVVEAVKDCAAAPAFN
ncbi:MAG TPA: DegT/DnrJ/EryC1/StrS family aminotransferase [Candidatus Udaeobacter sp.]|jgi:dTDP-4-amino-4,6-dideoxygalactose transaminase|nr:DegT/DnrJ/EryC1/StrS family aminotransferase [Candidatus Udaeobacter sp.]